VSAHAPGDKEAGVTSAALALALALSAPSAEVQPARARPGDAFLVVVRGAASAPSARAAGRDLALWPAPGGFAAVGGLPVETPPGPLDVEVLLPVDGGEPVRLAPRLEVEPAGFPHRALTVEKRFVRPPPPSVQRRIEADRAAFARAFDQPASPPLFAGSFAWPRQDRVTAGFGEQRTMNGVKPSQHYGLDLAGAVGAPVGSAQAGRVVLVRDCWASGRSVVVWHGAGLFTTYFHLSRALVREGDLVGRGQRLGLVGATGRVSGPHLHWGVRVGDLYVDPASVLRLPMPATHAAAR
jgi:murein DD-endopeptidase MepM/ murein hydrolase activator NlpD